MKEVLYCKLFFFVLYCKHEDEDTYGLVLYKAMLRNMDKWTYAVVKTTSYLKWVFFKISFINFFLPGYENGQKKWVLKWVIMGSVDGTMALTLPRQWSFALSGLTLHNEYGYGEVKYNMGETSS